MSKEAVVWIMFGIVVVCAFSTILASGIDEIRNDMYDMREALEALAELKAEIQGLQTALEAHDNKREWWEADDAVSNTD